MSQTVRYGRLVAVVAGLALVVVAVLALLPLGSSNSLTSDADGQRARSDGNFAAPLSTEPAVLAGNASEAPGTPASSTGEDKQPTEPAAVKAVGPGILAVIDVYFKRGEWEKGIKRLKEEIALTSPGTLQTEVRMLLLCALLKHGTPEDTAQVAVDFMRDAAAHRLDVQPVVGFQNRGLLTHPLRLHGEGTWTSTFIQLYWHTLWQLGDREQDRGVTLRGFVDKLSSLQPRVDSAETGEALSRKLAMTTEFSEINFLISKATVADFRPIRERVKAFVDKYGAGENDEAKTYVKYFRTYFPELWDPSIRPTDPIVVR